MKCVCTFSTISSQKRVFGSVSPLKKLRIVETAAVSGSIDPLVSASAGFRRGNQQEQPPERGREIKEERWPLHCKRNQRWQSVGLMPGPCLAPTATPEKAGTRGAGWVRVKGSDDLPPPPPPHPSPSLDLNPFDQGYPHRPKRRSESVDLSRAQCNEYSEVKHPPPTPTPPDHTDPLPHPLFSPLFQLYTLHEW